jgi:hypothetical protein
MDWVLKVEERMHREHPPNEEPCSLKPFKPGSCRDRSERSLAPPGLGNLLK